ncbi:MAG: hypothetical protein WKF78_06200 [Candidatus Limnocylindrales bacterium]
MARSPRTGRSPFARFGIRALVVGLILIVAVGAAIAAGVDAALTGQSFVSSFFPPVAVTDQGERIRDLYGIVFFIAVAIFFLVEGLIIWTVVRYKRRPGDDELPVQTHGNAHRRDRLDGRADDHRRVPVHHLVADPERRRHGVGHAGNAHPGRRRPVPVVLRLPRRRWQDRPVPAVPAHGRGRRDDRPDRADDQA